MAISDAELAQLVESVRKLESLITSTRLQLPRITNFKIASRRVVLGGEELILTWITDGLNISEIARFNIYVKNLLLKNDTPRLISSVTDSPAFIQLPTTQDSVILFQIEIEMKNGTRTDLMDSPTVTAAVAKGVVSEDDLSFSLLGGPFQIQPISSSVIDVGVLGTTTILDVSEEGALLYVRFTPIDNAGSLQTVNLLFSFDNESSVSYNIYDAASGVGTWRPPIQTITVQTAGSGTAGGDYVTCYIGFAYSTRCLIQLEVTSAHAGNRDVLVTVSRAAKI